MTRTVPRKGGVYERLKDGSLRKKGESEPTPVPVPVTDITDETDGHEDGPQADTPADGQDDEEVEG